MKYLPLNPLTRIFYHGITGAPLGIEVEKTDAVVMVTVERFIAGEKFTAQQAVSVDEYLNSGASLRELVEKCARDSNERLEKIATLANCAPLEMFE